MKLKLIGIGLLLLLLTGCNFGYWKEETITDCVKEKWIKGTSEQQKYLISTENNGVHQVADSFWKWHFRASDVYADIDEGECYVFTRIGWRIGFFSTYKNIIRVNTTIDTDDYMVLE